MGKSDGRRNGQHKCSGLGINDNHLRFSHCILEGSGECSDATTCFEHREFALAANYGMRQESKFINRVNWSYTNYFQYNKTAFGMAT